MIYNNSSEGALKGLKVLDMGRIIAAPFCAALLADMGADVIKVETPGGGDDARMYTPQKDGISTFFINFNRSKKGVTINLKSEQGKEVFLKLVKEADVLVENFRPGVMNKLGLGYEVLKEVNPGLIYAVISGFGQEGPYSKRPGFDPIAQAMCGITASTGWPEMPATRCGGSITDIMAGQNAAIGILAALQYRAKTGKGQFIDVALVDSGTVSMSSVAQAYLTKGVPQPRMGNTFTAGAPGNTYKCKDGYMVFMATSQKLWEKSCVVFGHEDWLTRPEYLTNADRVANHEMLDAEINEWMADKTVKEASDYLIAQGVPAAPIMDFAQIDADPHFSQRGLFTSVEHPELGKVRILNDAIRMSETNPHVRSCSPLLGEHNEEVFEQLGYTKEEIAGMKKSGAI